MHSRIVYLLEDAFIEMSYTLTSLRGLHLAYTGVIKGDTRSEDYSSDGLRI